MHPYGLGSAFPPTAHLLIRMSRGNLCGIVFVGDHMVAEPSSKIRQLDGMDGWNAQRRSPNIPWPAREPRVCTSGVVVSRSWELAPNLAGPPGAACLCYSA